METSIVLHVKNPVEMQQLTDLMVFWPTYGVYKKMEDDLVKKRREIEDKIEELDRQRISIEGLISARRAELAQLQPQPAGQQ